MATSPTEPFLALQLPPICHCQITVVPSLEVQRVTCMNCCVLLLDPPSRTLHFSRVMFLEELAGLLRWPILPDPGKKEPTSGSRSGLDCRSTAANFLGDSAGGAELERDDQGENKTRKAELMLGPEPGHTQTPCGGNGHRPSPTAQTPGSGQGTPPHTTTRHRLLGSALAGKPAP